MQNSAELCDKRHRCNNGRVEEKNDRDIYIKNIKFSRIFVVFFIQREKVK